MGTSGRRVALPAFTAALLACFSGMRPVRSAVRPAPAGLALELTPVSLDPAKKQIWRLTNIGSVPIFAADRWGWSGNVIRVLPSGETEGMLAAMCGNHRVVEEPLQPGQSVVVPQLGDFDTRAPGAGHLRFSVSFRLADHTRYFVEADFDLLGYDDEQLSRVRPLLTDPTLAGCRFRKPLFICAAKGAPPSFHDFATALGDLPVDEAEAYAVGLGRANGVKTLKALYEHGAASLRLAALAEAGPRITDHPYDQNDPELIAAVLGRTRVSASILYAVDPRDPRGRKDEAAMNAWLTRFETDSDPMVLCWIAYRLMHRPELMTSAELRRFSAAIPRALARLHDPIAREVFKRSRPCLTNAHCWATQPWQTSHEMRRALEAKLQRPAEPAACAAHEREARALAACDAGDWLRSLHIEQHIRADD